MTTVDRILDIIDAGLQTPVEDPTFGEVSPVVHDRCVRCQVRACVEESDFCVSCRAALLGDESPTATPEDIDVVIQACGQLAQDLAAVMASTVEATTAAIRRMAEAFESAGPIEPWLPVEVWELAAKADPVQRARARRARPEVCPRHGPTRGGLCRRCAR